MYCSIIFVIRAALGIYKFNIRVSWSDLHGVIGPKFITRSNKVEIFIIETNEIYEAEIRRNLFNAKWIRKLATLGG